MYQLQGDEVWQVTVCVGNALNEDIKQSVLCGKNIIDAYKIRASLVSNLKKQGYKPELVLTSVVLMCKKSYGRGGILKEQSVWLWVIPTNKPDDNLFSGDDNV